MCWAMDALPKNPTGKTLKRELRDKARAEGGGSRARQAACAPTSRGSRRSMACDHIASVLALSGTAVRN